MSGVPVFMYHALEDERRPSGAKDAGERLYVLQVKQFREQMEYLKREGYRTYLLEELHVLAEWPEKTVVITFDDGHESNYTLAFPVLREFGFKAHFFITTGWIGKQHFMNEDQIRTLHQAGMGIGSHGVTHRYLSSLDDRGIEIELKESKRTLERITGSSALGGGSAAGGRFDIRVQKIAGQCRYIYLCNSNPGMLGCCPLNFMVPRYAIRKTTALHEFISLSSCRPDAARRTMLRFKVLNIAKKILGNRVYEQVRILTLRHRNY